MGACLNSEWIGQLAQDYAISISIKKNLSLEREGELNILLLDEEPFASGSCWAKESHFSMRCVAVDKSVVH